MNGTGALAQKSIAPLRVATSWGAFSALVESTTRQAVASGLVARIWARDPSVWKPASHQQEIANRLGWLDAPGKAKSFLSDILSFAEEIRSEGTRTVVLLGMGGSSLAPEMFHSTFGRREGFPRLIVLDSTDPERVKDVHRAIRLDRTLFIFASKSGTTTEPFSFFKYFYAEAERVLKANAGRRFIAITDPKTSLGELAEHKRFRRAFFADPNVGGRYSALTMFGLLPAALTGVDVASVVSHAESCAAVTHLADAAANPALALGVAMAALAGVGRDKLTLVVPEEFGSFGDWAEQLVAESTGKEGKGVVPVVGETLASPQEYGNDRFFVAYMRPRPDAVTQKRLTTLEAAGHPVMRIPLKEKAALGAEIFCWEMATAIAGSLMGINPFDQPDVQSAKDKTKALLKEVEAGRSVLPKTTAVKKTPFRIAPSATLLGRDPWSALWGGLKENDTIHFLAFLPDRKPVRARLDALRARLRRVTKRAVTASFGPRYLHSSGQLHKGGAEDGVFAVIVAKRKTRLRVPGDKFSFEELELAQAVGDFQALDSKGRRAVFIQLPDALPATLQKLSRAVLAAVAQKAPKTGR